MDNNGYIIIQNIIHTCEITSIMDNNGYIIIQNIIHT